VITTSPDTGTERVAAALHRAWHPMPLRAQPANGATRQRVEVALRALPSHGWVDRRDRALLVLSHHAGISYRLIARLTRADVAVGDGTAIINTPAGSLTLQPESDGRLCGPCGLARWVHVLDLTVVHSHPAVIPSILARSVPLTATSPHLCEGNIPRTDAVSGGLLFPPIDPWGNLTVMSGPAGGYRVHNVDELEQRAQELQRRAGYLLDYPSIDTVHPGRVKGSP
jgi:hypothetical protein